MVLILDRLHRLTDVEISKEVARLHNVVLLNPVSHLGSMLFGVGDAQATVLANVARLKQKKTIAKVGRRLSYLPSQGLQF